MYRIILIKFHKSSSWKPIIMTLLYINNRKIRLRKIYKYLLSAFALALTTPVSAGDNENKVNKVNIFADIPLHLQNSSTTKTAYSVKPNIVFFIDSSASMIGKLKGSYKCRTRTSIKKNSKDKTIAWSPWGEYKYGYEKKTIPSNNNDNQYQCQEATRLDGVKDVLLSILANYRNDMYFAYRPLIGTDDRYNEFFEPSDPEQYKKLTSLIKNTVAAGGTPTTAQYPVMARNLVMNKLKYRCQKSYIVLLSDGEADDTSAKSDVVKDGYFDEGRSDAERYDFFVRAKYKNENKPKRLQYYTNTLYTKNFGPYIYESKFYTSDSFAIYSSAKKRLTDDAGQPWDTIDEHTKLPFEQKAETFTISVGLKEPNDKTATAAEKIAREYLEKGAMPADGKHNYNANSQENIIQAFKDIFDNIKGVTETTNTTSTATAPTVAISSSEQDNLSITAIIESGTWGSKLCIRRITDTNDSKCAQPSYGNRKLLLNNGTETYLYSANLSDLNNDNFKITNNGKNQSEWANGLLAWLSRSKPDEDIKSDNFELIYRQRTDSPLAGFGGTRDMGDIIDNPIITAGNLDGDYQKYMITSANDGMVYVFGATNNANFYDLKFNFMPMNIERQSNDGSDLVSHYYKDLVNENYGKSDKYPHRFLLNGGMVVQQTEQSVDPATGQLRPQQTFMVSTMGQAGRGAFAINIGGNDLISKNPIGVDNMGNADWYKNISLFQTPTGKDNYFGFTIGTPAIGRLRVNEDPDASPTSVANHIREIAFINNGYNYSDTLASDHASLPSSESALYIYDILGVDVGTDGYKKTGYDKGELISKLAIEQDPDSEDEEDEKATGGLSSPTAVDVDGDGVVDVVYAGDYSGNLYRFDLRSPNPDKWTVHKIFSAGAPITSAPGVIRASNNKKEGTVIVTFGTGSDVYQSDLTTKNQQTVYGIYDNLNDTAPTEVNKSALLRQELTTSGNYRMLTDNKFNPKVHRGWYFNLDRSTGERVVSKPVIISYAGAIISRAYDVKKDNKLEDPCQETVSEQKSEVYSGKIQYNIKTGGRLKQGDPNFVFDKEAPFGAGTITLGMYSFTISNFNNNVDIGGSGTQSPLDPDGKNYEECTRSPVVGVDTEGNLINIIVPKCPIKFKRLSWKEVKNSYFN